MDIKEIEKAIEETKNQIRQTTSPYCKSDLEKYLSKLKKRKDKLTHGKNYMGVI